MNLIDDILNQIWDWLRNHEGIYPEKIIITSEQYQYLITEDKNYLRRDWLFNHKEFEGIPVEIYEEMKRKDEIESEAFLKLIGFI